MDRLDFHNKLLNTIIVLLAMVVLCMQSADAAPPQPPTDLSVVDHPNDVGKQLDLTWKVSPDDVPGAETRKVSKYEIRRKTAAEAEFKAIGEKPAGSTSFDDSNCEPKTGYFYQIVALGPDNVASAPIANTEPAVPVKQYFYWNRAWFGLILVIICGMVVFFIEIARRGYDLKTRRIAGLEAVDEAVGRSVEMGRPCLFVPGIQDINDIQTVAGLSILSRVAKTAAEYGARVEVPTSRSLVMTAAREAVESACLSAGRPDDYNENLIYYVTDEQFGYAASVTGTMVREKPAACFYMGAFYAESLFFAETGNSIGAIQVAGTAEPAQLPFFVAACDYTLIGEEYFAASAYLSGEPHQLGSLKGQDVGKFIVAALVFVGCGLATLQQFAPEQTWVATALTYLKESILGNG